MGMKRGGFVFAATPPRTLGSSHGGAGNIPAGRKVEGDQEKRFAGPSRNKQTWATFRKTEV